MYKNKTNNIMKIDNNPNSIVNQIISSSLDAGTFLVRYASISQLETVYEIVKNISEPKRILIQDEIKRRTA